MHSFTHNHIPFIHYAPDLYPTDPPKQSPKRISPLEFPDSPEKYTDTIVAVDHMELIESETDPNPGLNYSERTAKQTCDYHAGNKAAPDNNLFFEERSNPLSSKGN